VLNNLLLARMNLPVLHRRTFRVGAVLGVGLLMSLTGCSLLQKQKFLEDDFRTEEIRLPFRLGKARILDLRNKISEKPMKMSNFALPGTKEKVEPELTDAQRQLMESEVRRYLTETADPINLDLRIHRGEKRFETKWTREVETVELEIEVILVDRDTVQSVGSARGSSLYYVTSIDASPDYTEKLYQKSIRAALYHAFRSLKTLFPDVAPASSRNAI